MGKIDSNWETRILLVGENPVLLKLIEHSITNTNHSIAVRQANSLEHLFRELFIFSPDVVITMRSNRKFKHTEVAKIVHQFNSYIDVYIVVSEKNAEMIHIGLNENIRTIDMFQLGKFEEIIWQGILQKRKLLISK